ncbi:MAG: choice-of-anchor X domain-containing protein [Bacteroidota bacterium]
MLTSIFNSLLITVFSFGVINNANTVKTADLTLDQTNYEIIAENDNVQENETTYTMTASEKGEFFKRNVSFTDARVRSLSSSQYVKEIVFTNFSEQKMEQTSVIFQGTTFFDDGSHNDLKAGDGIYTSAAKFNHTANVPYNSEYQVRSVMEEVVVDKSFAHSGEIESRLSSYTKPGSTAARASGGPTGSLDCAIEFGTCGCRADNWGWCDCCCFTLSDCRISIGWG